MRVFKNNSKYVAFCEDLKRKEKSIRFFYNSPIYKKMVGDIKRKNLELSSCEWKLFPEKIRELFGWGEDIYDNHINTFIYSLCFEDFPVDSQKEISENIYMLFRDGLEIKIVVEDVVHIIINPIKT